MTPPVLVDFDDGLGPCTQAQVYADGRAEPHRDLPYFIEVAEVAAALTPDVERYVLSFSPQVGRHLTPRDVWFVIGDETATPVPYTAPCPVFRTHGEKFEMPWRGFHSDWALAASEVGQWLRNRVRGELRTSPPLVATRRRPKPGWLPLGLPGWTELPDTVPPLADRPIDVGFRGSIEAEEWQPGRYRPKTISRRRMADIIPTLRSDIVVDFNETASFLTSYGLDPTDYAQSLLNTKIALSPRGGCLETFRSFEAALAGCVLITEPIPRAWFYAGLPRWEVRSWKELPAALDELLSNPDAMEVLSRGARDWAMNVVSPTAIGEWVARRLHAGDYSPPDSPTRRRPAAGSALS